MKELRNYIEDQINYMDSFIEYSEREMTKELKGIHSIEDRKAKIDEWEVSTINTIKQARSEGEGAVWFAYRMKMIGHDELTELNQTLLNAYFEKVTKCYETLEWR